MLPQGTKVYFAVQPVDLRRSFDGLAATAQAALQRDPARGGLFVFLNKRADQVRVLFKNRHGWCYLAQRVDQGRFRRPTVSDGATCWELDPQALLRFLEDIDLARASRLRTKPAAATPALSLVPADMQ